MKMNLFVAAASTLLLAACAPQNQSHEIAANNSQAGIFGGDEVKASEAIAATTVGLYNTRAGYICTGSLYGKNMVITAAHCLEGAATDLEVRFGIDMRRPSVIRKVVAGKRHSNFTGAIKPNMGDVSVVKYEGTIPDGFRSAPILSNYSSLTKGSKIVAAGYGISNPTRGNGEGLLRKNTLKIKNPGYTSSEISVDQSMINGVCNGDSGGPAFLQGNDGRLYLWGVTSNGAGLPGVRPCMFFAVFTRVDTYMPWIVETASGL